MDAAGTAWGTPISIDVAGNVGYYTSLQIVNGNPAISYYDVINLDLKYVRASDAAGSTAWGTPVSVDVTGDVGQYNSLQIVNGKPAISYYDQTNGVLKYVQALDAAGSAWGTRVTVDNTGTVGKYTCLQIVNGNPAISYNDIGYADLKYVRANNLNGTAWATPVTLDATGTTGQYSSMVSGNTGALIAYFNSSQGLPYFVASNDYVLPLKLLSFNGAKNGNKNILQWQTDNEVNTRNFVVEKSLDAIKFQTFGTVQAKGNGKGFYSFEETMAGTSGVVYYRLKMFDIDNRFTYSNTIQINRQAEGEINIYPSPVKDKITLRISNPAFIGTIAKITDLNGKTIKDILLKNSTEIVDMSSLPAGIYLLKTVTNTTKIIKN